MMGGFGDAKQVTDEVKTLCDGLKEKIEAQCNKSFDTWEPICYKTQVVAGTNYLVKIKVAEGDFVHAKIFKALPCNGGECSVTTATTGHSESDTL
jgi:hypothetical protein